MTQTLRDIKKAAPSPSPYLIHVNELLFSIWTRFLIPIFLTAATLSTLLLGMIFSAGGFLCVPSEEGGFIRGQSYSSEQALA